MVVNRSGTPGHHHDMAEINPPLNLKLKRLPWALGLGHTLQVDRLSNKWKTLFLDLVTFLLDLDTFIGPYYNSFGDGYPSFGPAHPPAGPHPSLLLGLGHTPFR